MKQWRYLRQKNVQKNIGMCVFKMLNSIKYHSRKKSASYCAVHNFNWRLQHVGKTLICLLQLFTTIIKYMYVEMYFAKVCVRCENARMKNICLANNCKPPK